jgi:23S rRNA-/tRNA-specific pseudouridylate synthase
MFGAKSLSGARKFNKLIELRNNLSKEYICFVYGIPRQLSGVIQTPLVFDEVKKRAKIVNYTKAEYKECATQYQVV